MLSSPVSVAQPIGLSWFAPGDRGPCAANPCSRRTLTRRLSEASSTSRASVDFPDPETPVTTVKRASGNQASKPAKLCSVALMSLIAGRSGLTGRRGREGRSGGDNRQRAVVDRCCPGPAERT